MTLISAAKTQLTTRRRVKFVCDAKRGQYSDAPCIQELDKGDYEGSFGTGMFFLGYEGNQKNPTSEHGFAIFIRSICKDAATLVSDCPIPFPQGVVQGVDVPGVTLVLDINVELQRVCVATAHIPSSDSQGGLRKVGQIMALLPAATDLLRKDQEMVFILTGDFNVNRSDKLAKFITTGSLDMVRMKPPPPATLKAFIAQTQPLRDVLSRPSLVSMEPSPNPIESGVDLENMVVSHPVHAAIVYSVNSIVNFIFSGSVAGSRQLKVVACLEFPPSLEQLKAGLPAGHLGSDHLALGAKFRIRLEWSGTPDYYLLWVEVVVPTGRKRYFPLEVTQKPAKKVKSIWDTV
ncbi:hypothetical protein BGZ70_002736 [Mortierella alpina]|uniref:Endonuclease/exonuclease/phosphatase domain-containing protein n=1 Tax=Mortierella alpina TaxID=64518 RepID=A0A9P6IVA8_MORAP|nr:hypothetical protein BGZ70_002736 [Mortierella alpina]